MMKMESTRAINNKVMENKVLVNFDIKSCVNEYDGDALEYKVNERFDGNIRFDELIRYLTMKYIVPTAKNLNNPYCYSINFYDVLWEEYFDNKSGFTYIYSIDNNYPESLKLELWQLDKQFNLSNKTFELMICGPGIGGGVGEYNGIRFYFHTREKDIHHVPHIHCSYSGQEFRVNLETLSIMDKPFNNKSKTKKALKLIKLNQTALIKYWNKVVLSGEYLKFEMIYF